MVTGATLFTGGGGVDIGMRSAGIEVVYGCEYDDDIAAVAQANGVPVTVGDVLDINPHDLPLFDVLHASPPCPNFSVAKRDRGETAHDLALARKIADIVLLTSPDVFTLENVPAYRDSQSFQHIVRRLAARGYMLQWSLINAADFGVPQTRRRLWLRAVRDRLLSPLPAPVPWVGWYAAIEDLLPTLPESQFAPWQMARLPEHLRTLLLPATGHSNQEDGGLPRHAGEPAQTIRAQRQGLARAFIVDDQNNGSPSASGGRGLTIRNSQEPTFTVSATQTRRSIRAMVTGRVVAMTPRALARFQSFPDWYALPPSNQLACRIIGNAVPPLLYQRVIKGMVL